MSSHQRRVVLLAMAGIAQLTASSPKADDAGLAQLVAGAVARHRAVSSGRFEYRVVTGFRTKGGVINEHDAHFSFSGASWAWRYPDGHVTVNHDGKWMRFGQSEQADGSVDRGLQILPAEAVDKNRPCPPFFAGTFWYDTPATFIRTRAANARDKGEVEINGVQTRLLEWEVTKPYDAFHGIYEILRPGGFLRIYVAPQLGYALPRYEYVARDGVVGMRFDAAQFQEVAPGIFFPTQCSQQGFDPKPAYYVEYQIKGIERINDAIPEEDFQIKIPAGTMITDGRGPHGVAFWAGTTPPPGFEEGKVLVFDDEPVGVWRTWPGAIGIGIAIGLLLILVFLWVRRRKRPVTQS